MVAIVVVVLLLVVGTFIVIAKKVDTRFRAASPTGFDKVLRARPSPPDARHRQWCPGTEAVTKPSTADVTAVTGRTVVATLSTNRGDIVIDLDGAKGTPGGCLVRPTRPARLLEGCAPAPVDRGRRLDRRSPVRRPHGDDPGQPGYGFAIENAPADGIYRQGVLAMARPSANTEGNGGQFFIVYKDSTIPRDSAGGCTISGA